MLSSPIPLFRWTPVTNYNPGAVQPSYKLKVCPVFQGQNPRTAIDANPVLFEKKNIATTFYQSIPGDLQFDFYPQVSQYVWMVQAFDANGRPLGANQGRSELGTFRVGKPTEEYAIENVYPVAGDTVPWLHPQLIARISPFDSKVKKVTLKVYVREEGTSASYTYQKDIYYGSQQFAPPITPELAGLVVCNYSNGTIDPFMAALRQGKKHLWRVESTVTQTDGKTVTIQSRETAFTAGLRTPKNLKPKADTAIVRNKALELQFDVEQPMQLNFPNTNVFRIPSFNGFNAIANAQARIRFEISKKSSFDSLVYLSHVSTTSEINGNFEKHTATYQGQEYFDYCDFSPITWISSGNANRFGPLVKINAWERNSQWHQQFANPHVYDEISWMKSRGYWSGTVKYDEYFSNPNLNFIDISFNTQRVGVEQFASQVLGIAIGGSSQASGTGAASSVSGGFAPGNQPANLNVLQASSGTSPYIRLTYNHGIIVPADFLTLRNRAFSVLSNPLITLNGANRSRLNTIVNRSYQMMLRGSYPMNFFYNYSGCRAVDSDVITVSKPFIY